MTKDLPNGNNWFDMVYGAKNLLLSYAVTIVLLFVSAVAAAYFAMPDSAIDILTAVISAVCIMWGGFRSARHAGRHGLLTGALFGLGYTVILYLIGSLVDGALAFRVGAVLSVIIGIACGAIGGMAGVNTKPKKRR
ncbi:TIGR04086 family membrane protein [Ructibacterium gallinarum]|uniref:TIGR04086 family membrane protein n=1 Tax=Ructibacterium gallinarum TaxID=2779355 RepID=A0A9D5M171_9FIRM|nr:TIGR04086 family membrane protein [Ructibacterium gallinarum]MBE5040395.1 TIGR04086 family membrane protein [Ructibacterium gallinarum]